MLTENQSYDNPSDFRTGWFQPNQYASDSYSTESSEEQDFKFILVDGAIIAKSSIPSRYQSALGGVEKHIKQMVAIAALESKWADECITEPNEIAKHLAFSTAKYIFSKHKLIPITIRASIECGIMITYWNNLNECSLKIEVYNDGERAGLINQNKKIVKCIDIESTADLTMLVDRFKGTNSQAGEAIKIKAAKVPGFKSGKSLREAG